MVQSVFFRAEDERGRGEGAGVKGVYRGCFFLFVPFAVGTAPPPPPPPPPPSNKHLMDSYNVLRRYIGIGFWVAPPLRVEPGW